MLEELHVSQLGVVEDLTLMFRPGMTAVTGETGAGKTMIVEAIRLLTGGRAEPHVIRNGATEASIEGRFGIGDEERILARVIPVEGRSRAYVDGRISPVSALSETGEDLVDLHGQHAHQSLLSSVAQRYAIDASGSIDLRPLHAARRELHRIGTELEKLGGDAQSRAREIDLLRFQLEEIDAAQLDDPNEEESLQREELVLADASAHREAAAHAYDALADDGGVNDSLAIALKAIAGRSPFASLESQLRNIISEVADVAAEASSVADRMTDNPERLAAVQDRRQALKQLQRKYGSTLAEVIRFRDESKERLSELERHDEVVAGLEDARTAATKVLQQAETAVGKARRAVSPKFAAEVQSRLRELALPNAKFEVRIGEDAAADDIEFMLGPNPGMPVLPVAKAASGGELARTMLAIRLALMESTAGDGPQTLIFDEVDAGIGGEAAVAVGEALAALTRGESRSQVLVVTHLAQVAAFADQHVSVQKEQSANSTVARIRELTDEDREIELARMLSGRPDSKSGRTHARELMDHARSAATAEPKPKRRKNAK